MTNRTLQDLLSHLAPDVEVRIPVSFDGGKTYVYYGLDDARIGATHVGETNTRYIHLAINQGDKVRLQCTPDATASTVVLPNTAEVPLPGATDPVALAGTAPISDASVQGKAVLTPTGDSTVPKTTTKTQT